VRTRPIARHRRPRVGSGRMWNQLGFADRRGREGRGSRRGIV